MIRTAAFCVAWLLAGVVAAADKAPSSAPPVMPNDEAKEGFVSLFNGKDLTGWQGATGKYAVRDGVLVCQPNHSGSLFTQKEYGDFVLRFSFRLTPGANNGIGIRTPLKGDAAYAGMEIQVLDDPAPRYQNLQPYQYHGSIYGVVPATRGHLKPAGQWNEEEIEARGSHVKITLNGTAIVDADLSKIETTIDHKGHPGLHRPRGYIALLGHQSVVEFRDLRIKSR